MQWQCSERVSCCVTVHGPEGRGTAIWRVSPPHNVADLGGSVTASSFAATLRGGGHAPPRERLPCCHLSSCSAKSTRTLAVRRAQQRLRSGSHYPNTCALCSHYAHWATVRNTLQPHIGWTGTEERSSGSCRINSNSRLSLPPPSFTRPVLREQDLAGVVQGRSSQLSDRHRRRAGNVRPRQMLVG